MLNMSYEELMALGLTDEEAKAIAINTSSSSGGAGLPFPQLKLNYEADAGKVGSYLYDTKKDKEGTILSVGEAFENGVEFIMVAVRCQYSKFDATLGRSVVSSNIVNTRDSKTAVDLKSGMSIAKLGGKEAGIKYTKIIAGLLKSADGSFKPFLSYISGAALFAFNEAIKDEDLIRSVIKIGGTVKGKKGSVVFYTPTDITVTDTPMEDVVKNIKQVAEVSKKFNAWVAGVNGTLGTKEVSDTPTNTASKGAKTQEEDIVW